LVCVLREIISERCEVVLHLTIVGNCDVISACFVGVSLVPFIVSLSLYSPIPDHFNAPVACPYLSLDRLSIDMTPLGHYRGEEGIWPLTLKRARIRRKRNQDQKSSLGMESIGEIQFRLWHLFIRSCFCGCLL